MLEKKLVSPYIDEIIGDYQCGFRHNRSTNNQIFCIVQMLEKKLEYNETVHQPFIVQIFGNDSNKSEFDSRGI
jgi:hypothetical protein